LTKAILALSVSVAKVALVVGGEDGDGEGDGVDGCVEGDGVGGCVEGVGLTAVTLGVFPGGSIVRGVAGGVGTTCSQASRNGATRIRPTTPVVSRRNSLRLIGSVFFMKFTSCQPSIPQNCR